MLLYGAREAAILWLGTSTHIVQETDGDQLKALIGLDTRRMSGIGGRLLDISVELCPSAFAFHAVVRILSQKTKENVCAFLVGACEGRLQGSLTCQLP